ncbi:MAG: fused signal recognition particle receptor [Candidatus Sumerlaeota bacterium]|nr:fused signal recognition particle receptor [Candidatus Sumerlaeota bacterium]
MDEQKRRKPGFFSRLFTVTETDAPPEPVETEELPAEPVAEAEPPEEKKSGVFGRLFGRKDKQAEDAPAEEPAVEEPTAEPPEPVLAPIKKGWLRRLTERLTKTRRGLIDNIRSILGISGKLDEETIEELEAALLQGDVSAETTQKIIARMKAVVKGRDKDLTPEDLLDVFKESVREILANSAPGFEPVPPPDGGPYVVMVVGVNGAGKTTTIAKMAKRCTDAGLRTMLVAGDTFRAAAVEQLEVWATRTGADFVRAPHGSDAAALCYDALAKARQRGSQVVFIDTAGRLHTKSTLMDELAKIERVIAKQLPGAPHETLLVLDATTGQNALQQVKTFSACVRVTGLILTKLDGTAKGGILLSILDQYRIPITLIGVGESAADLRDFDPDQFAMALFGEEGAEG